MGFPVPSWSLLVTVAAAILLAWAVPNLWARAEALLGVVSRRKGLCCAAAVLVVLVTRLALLAFWEIPKPFVHDEYGYLLQADTFASGRLTNPTHPMAEFFDAPYVFHQPTYNAKFPPGQGLVLALGQIVLGHPWFGVWLSCGALAGLVCWCLQGWFRPGWALLGAAFVVPYCVFSYWMNSYWGGAVAAGGSALLFGSVPRLRAGSAGAAALFSLGAIVLILTRPFEGSLMLLPLLPGLAFGKLRVRQWMALAATGLVGLLFFGYYNLRVTGDPLRMPYTEYESQYPMTSHFNILSLPPHPEYAGYGLRMVDHWERSAWTHARLSSFPLRRALDLATHFNGFYGSFLVFLPAILFAPHVLRNRRLRAVVWAVGLTAAAAFFEVLFFAHYAAPVLVPLLILIVHGLRHLRCRSSILWTRALVLAAILLALRDPASKLLAGQSLNPSGGREVLEQLLADQLGPQVIVVRRTNPKEPDWDSYPAIELAPVPVEFVHNGANIDREQIVWANDLGDTQNQRLRDYFKGRTFWLYQPDVDPDRLFAWPAE